MVFCLFLSVYRLLQGALYSAPTAGNILVAAGAFVHDFKDITSAGQWQRAALALPNVANPHAVAYLLHTPISESHRLIVCQQEVT